MPDRRHAALGSIICPLLMITCILPASGDIAVNYIVAQGSRGLSLEGTGHLENNPGFPQLTVDSQDGKTWKSLGPNTAHVDGFIKGSNCARLKFSSSTGTYITAFVTTLSNAESMLSQDTIDLSKAQPVSFSTFTNQSSGEALVNVDYNETSLVVLANTGPSTTDVTFTFSGYSKASGGDSGGPLIKIDPGNNTPEGDIIVGIVSAGDSQNCTPGEGNTLYSNVNAFNTKLTSNTTSIIKACSSSSLGAVPNSFIPCVRQGYLTPS